MSSQSSNYEKYKIIVESVSDPCAILSVEKKHDGTIGEIRIIASNDKFSMTGEEVEGELYTKFLPRNPEFEGMCYRAAFQGEKIHTYIDARKMLGAWADNLLLPIKSEGGDIGYCQYIYELTKEMDAGKFSTISPSIAGFVIKSCLELRGDNDFKVNLEQVLTDILEYTDAATTSVISIDHEKKKAEVVCQVTKPGFFGAEQGYDMIPYGITEKWEELVGECDCFVMRSKADLDRIEEVSPIMMEKLKIDNVQNFFLVPLMQRKEITGYILLTNFNVDNALTIKETLTILSLFLSSEMANSQFLKRLEWLTSVDLLTGVRNRAAMNRVVDEYAELLKWKKSPFGVAFCMMNGLKYLNDKNGHDAGNKCLEEAGKILREVFDETEVFRSGGEEFSIVCENMEEEEFKQKIEKLREMGNNPDGVHFAIGYAYDNKEGDIRAALRGANKMMQIESEAFFEKYPEKKY